MPIARLIGYLGFDSAFELEPGSVRIGPNEKMQTVGVYTVMWKGTYNNQAVAIKQLREERAKPKTKQQMEKVHSVSTNLSYLEFSYNNVFRDV